MKQVFWFLCASIVPALFGGSFASVVAQTSTPTPDPFTVQLTSTNPGFNVVMGDISADGRFVVFVSNGNLATNQSPSRNNLDGNREIFIYDYAQRRIFQVTNTKNVPNPTPSPSPTPSPTPSPSPTPTPSPSPSPSPTPAIPSQVKIEIDNRAPMISFAPTLSEGQRVYTIVFSSNAPDPENFDGTNPANLGDLETDGNSEIWIYRLPAVPDVDLTLGTDLPFFDLMIGGDFDQVTDTDASRAPRPGTTITGPFFADDNREPAITDNGNIIAFISTRNHVPGVGNADGNPELFFYNVGSEAFTQATNTQDVNQVIGLVFQSNPSLSADGSVVSFTSSANLATNNTDGNAEIFLADFGGGGLSNIRQVTRTLNSVTNSANVASPGRRLSRDGAFITFESRATDPKANATVSNLFLGFFVYTVATDTFVEIGTRSTTVTDFIRFPTFTDYNGGLTPATLLFTSRLNFRPDGSIPANAQAAEGLNPQFAPQVFVTAMPVGTTQTFTRLTHIPEQLTLGGMRPVPAATRKRIGFAVGGADLGGGNFDESIELFYLLTPQITATSTAALSFFTGMSNMPVTAATPIPSPSPTPTPTPSPVPGAPIGLAAGELAIVRSTADLAPSDAVACTTNDPPCASETDRVPALPVELNGVSLSVNGAAAGLYAVDADSKQINFVVPVTVPVGLQTVAVANGSTLLRGLLLIVLAQPDIFTDSNGEGGRAGAINAINGTGEPFSVTTDPPGGGAAVPTVIQLSVTGLRGAARGDITVTVGTTAITGDAIVSITPNLDMPGFDLLNFTLPASLAGAGDVPIQVTFARGTTFSAVSRPAATAPRITIN